MLDRNGCGSSFGHIQWNPDDVIPMGQILKLLET